MRTLRAVAKVLRCVGDLKPAGNVCGLYLEPARKLFIDVALRFRCGFWFLFFLRSQIDVQDADGGRHDNGTQNNS